MNRILRRLVYAAIGLALGATMCRGQIFHLVRTVRTMIVLHDHGP